LDAIGVFVTEEALQYGDSGREPMPGLGKARKGLFQGSEEVNYTIYVW
jgi:hypothetical protein